MAPHVHASTFFRERERESWAGLMSTHLSQSLLNGEQCLQTLPSRQRDAKRQEDLGEREVRVSAFKLSCYPAPRSLRGWGHGLGPCFIARAGKNSPKVQLCCHLEVGVYNYISRYQAGPFSAGGLLFRLLLQIQVSTQKTRWS